mmetsp:Transcript_60863/g.69578  ORF Transcript_60863/g.69578 Transcript_60863/m.69578 type:complete len:254 (+) Transcript_60863:3639-4400(+)
MTKRAVNRCCCPFKAIVTRGAMSTVFQFFSHCETSESSGRTRHRLGTGRSRRTIVSGVAFSIGSSPASDRVESLGSGNTVIFMLSSNLSSVSTRGTIHRRTGATRAIRSCQALIRRHRRDGIDARRVTKESFLTLILFHHLFGEGISGAIMPCWTRGAACGTWPRIVSCRTLGGLNTPCTTFGSGWALLAVGECTWSRRFSLEERRICTRWALRGADCRPLDAIETRIARRTLFSTRQVRGTAESSRWTGIGR